MIVKFNLSTKIALLVGLSLSIPSANAALIQIATPNAAYTSGTTLIPVTGNDGDTTSVVGDAKVVVTFSSPMQKFIGSWGTWGTPPAVETSTPNVLAPAGPDFQSVTTITLSFSTGLSTFGMEVQPDAFTQGFFPVSAEFRSGATILGTIFNSMDGSTAALFAGSSTTPITSVILTIAGNGNLPAGTDPAIAQLRYSLPPSEVPEPATVFSTAAGFLMLAGIRRLRSARK